MTGRNADLRIHHSSSELYGSDRSLLSLAEAGVRRGSIVEVHLPEAGPLVEALRVVGACVSVDREVVLRRSRPISTAWDVLRGGAMRLRSKDASPPRLIVSNTSAVLTPLFIARATAPWAVIVREHFSSSLERKAFQVILSSAAGIVCVSESVRNQFDTSFLARVPTIVVHSGADVKQFHAVEKSTDDRLLGGFRILCVGRLLLWKGQDLLLEALALLPADFGRLEVRIVGSEYGLAGKLTADLMRRAAALPPNICVEFAGESRQVIDHYAWADAVVVPSRKAEPFGKVVIEGMAAGCVVIASGHGGPAEVIEHGITGVLFRPGSREDLANAIVEVMSNAALRRELAMAGRAASHEWSADAAAGRILDFFGSLTP